MKCPNCETIDLLMSEKKGIEIDFCPKCRGIWLDRGELDKIIEPSTSSRERRDDKEYYEDDDRYRRRKRKSLLGELLDF